VINDRTYGADCAHGELRLSLLHSPGYAAHPIMDRLILPEDRYSPRHDQGERLFHFWLQGGPAAERLEAVDREALAHNEKPMALSFFPEGGGNPSAAGVRLSDSAVQLVALKKAEVSDALVLRLFEPTGQARETRVELPFAGASYTARLGAFEVLTLCYHLRTGLWTQVNLMEENG
jgi:alpha-mannosidase